ncbi:DNA replication/repair protein RecF [Calidifontibacter sp. DB0510]|uniref:DNA replication and repair protein RecF n=1 Tax=Metallococcus carri TaxID=1656884 RepID=A0A967AZW2_9MICO|nr:DNA replication/repair protein RecF [Metallococcus carri]NHN56196.1 DNA replication/repair protein RecF [Metallococcus carri]NOP38753.1 DNA replication/repair protein RecF [Calidifontibacter sp. DB2511S]
MHVRHLSLVDFRSYETAEVALEPGVGTFVGLNGQGKTNLVEAIGYVATLASHRVAQDAPLVRSGAEKAAIRLAVVRDGREQQVELEILPGRANRARLGRGGPVRPREILGTLRTVLFAPEDLQLVKGDPAARRTFLDDLLVARQPRWAGARADYDKILKNRNALLRSGRQGVDRGALEATLPVWDEHLASVGAHLIYARLRLLRDLAPYVGKAYDEVSAGASDAGLTYRSGLHEQMAEALAAGEVPEVDALQAAIHQTFEQQRRSELDRGVTLVGPHRDEVTLRLGELPAKGYASHGESWSFALALRLGAFQLLRHDLGTDPVLVLDDVFAELDGTRRERLAAMVADAEQVLVTAAVAADVPPELAGRMYDVTKGSVTARE